MHGLPWFTFFGECDENVARESLSEGGFIEVDVEGPRVLAGRERSDGDECE